MTGPDFPALLAAAVEREGLRAFARRAGVSPTMVWKVQQRGESPGPKILAALGWEKVVIYRKIRGS